MEQIRLLGAKVRIFLHIVGCPAGVERIRSQVH